MGMAGAMGMADQVNEGNVSLDAALHWHLRSNHFPPHPVAMIPVAKAAIEAFQEDDVERLIQLPDGIEFRDGRTAIEATTIVNSLRLDAFVIDYDEVDW